MKKDTIRRDGALMVVVGVLKVQKAKKMQ